MKKSALIVLPAAAALFVTIGCGGSHSPAADPGANTEGGAAGTPAADPSKPVGPKAANAGQKITTPLLDDFEDGDGQSPAVDGRGGYWYTYADKDGTTIEPMGNFSPAKAGDDPKKVEAAEGDEAAGANKVAAPGVPAKAGQPVKEAKPERAGHWGRMNGTLGTAQVVYAGMGMSFTDPKAPYDASSCKGVSFLGKKSGDGTAAVRLKVGDWQTSPEGGLCQQCYNDFGAEFTFTDEWTEYTSNFADMKQEPYWGEPKMAIDPTALYQLQWQVKASGAAFDIQVDDVKLIGCDG